MKEISSLQNPLVKQTLQLQSKSKERRKQELFVAEGLRELELALRSDYRIVTLMYCPELLAEPPRSLLQEATDIVRLDLAVYQKLAYRGSTQGIMALCRSRSHRLEDLELERPRPLILVAQAPEKPGNIGALLRTADAAGLDAVIIADPKTDLYNPNIIRGSVGCVFTNQIATAASGEVIAYLRQQNLAIYCAALQASIPYHSADLTVGAAVVVGTEAEGLSDEWLEASDQNIIIPMSGSIDSMNVSVAAGILIFEAKRQRGFS